MESHASPNDLNDQQVLPTNQLGENVAIEGEHHLRGPQHSPQTTEELIVTSRVRRNSQAQDHVVVNMDLIILDPQVQDSYLSIQGPVAFQVGLSSVVDLILGPNQSNPIWRLRLLAAFTLVVATMVAVLYLPENIHGVHATYWYEAKNSLERYAYRMKNSMKNKSITGTLPFTTKIGIENAIQETLSWVEDDPFPDVAESESRMDKLMSICAPIDHM
ncbi:heat shock protein 70 [Carex littledalei]|uniref:Heat shock protein 70 n=1 Tax=Carex littledalei TaxID=544730 RepID=A0A833RQY1_9POAL|nr:heat shock protein 70 [Carex littledalei]